METLDPGEGWVWMHGLVLGTILWRTAPPPHQLRRGRRRPCMHGSATLLLMKRNVPMLWRESTYLDLEP